MIKNNVELVIDKLTLKMVNGKSVTISNCSKGLGIKKVDIALFISSGEEGLEPSTVGFENQSSTN